jgi:hypothetical protein
LGYYGTPFKAGRGVTQGGPLSAKLFNILVDAVIREWFWQLQESGGYEEDELFGMMAAFFAIFYVDNAYLASWDAGFFQHALDILVNLFKRVGPQTNTSKTLTMICTPGRIQTQLSTELYRRMQRGRVIDFTPARAIAAAKTAHLHQLAMADAAIYSITLEHKATLWTQDADYQKLPQVQYFSKV